MASSMKSSRDGQAVRRSPSRAGTSRLTTGGILVGAGLSSALVLGAAVLALGAFTSRPLDAALPDGRIAAVQASADGQSDEATRTVRRLDVTNEHEYEETHAKMLAALAVTEDPAIAVLPAAMTLAAVDKSIRPARASVLGDERAVAILKEALQDAADQRAARLALAAELGKQNLKLSREAQMLASLETDADPETTGSIPSGAVLAYAPARSAADTMTDAEDPFDRVLSGVDEAEAGLIEDIPVPLAKPDLPEPPKAKLTPNTARPSRLAVAQPDNPIVEEDDKRPSLFGRKATLPKASSRIAVYDISAGVVYMPNGEKLEAHSGRGAYRDNPKYVHVKNRGSTPPNVYKLRMRESRFHGIEAIRMLPVGDSKMYGRDGFLTHTYLLRVRGDSSGCVVFPQYNRFLNAFKRGQVAHLIVVPRMAELPRYLAML
ncbi:DUF2778 domain-containing protein [Pseudomonas sp. R2.Fl]|nr:DUF2778 domain-containing protein [Pseudomonas sp. R2.Fl]